MKYTEFKIEKELRYFGNPENVVYFNNKGLQGYFVNIKDFIKLVYRLNDFIEKENKNSYNEGYYAGDNSIHNEEIRRKLYEKGFKDAVSKKDFTNRIFKTYKNNKPKLKRNLNIVKDREAGMKFKDIAKKYRLSSKQYARDIYMRWIDKITYKRGVPYYKF